MKVWMKRAAFLTTVAVTVGVLAGCSAEGTDTKPTSLDPSTSSWADIEAAAKSEGKLTVYLASQDGLNTALVEAFNEAYPDIQVNMLRLESGASTARIASEIEAGTPTADVVQLADNVMFNEHPEWFRPIAGLPNLENFPEERYTDYYVHQQAGLFVYTYNTDLVKNPPKTWKELAASEAIKDGLMIDPRAANSFMAMDQFIREAAGEDVLADLAANVRGFTDSSATAAQQVVAGEISLAFPNQREHTTAAREKGAPVDTVVPSPSIAVTNMYAMPKQATSPNAAAVFMNFVLSKAGAEATCLKGDYMPFAYSDIPNCPQAPTDTDVIVDYYPKLTDQVRSEIIDILGLS